MSALHNERSPTAQPPSTRYEDFVADNDNNSGSPSCRSFRDWDPPRSREHLRSQDADEHGRPNSTMRMSGRGSNTSRSRSRSDGVVGWRDLPNKQQLFVITMARLSEPLVQTSLQSYMFYQLKWFNPDLPDATISSQAGILHASFTAAQFLTAMLWGRVADASWAGRKTVILIGLFGTFLSCIGFGLSTNFWQALGFRLLGGITNGNIGVLRTMISEVVREKKYQSRAFLLLPMCFNIGVIIGPILGGILSDPAGTYPVLFGNVEFLIRFPYAAPNLVSAVFMMSACIMAWLFLEETLDSRLNAPDYGIKLGKKITGWWTRRRHGGIAYQPLHSRNLSSSTASTEMELSPGMPRDSLEGQLPREEGDTNKPGKGRRYTQRLAFHRIFTPNVMLTFVAHFFLAWHLGSFNSLYAVFLSTPVHNPESTPGSKPQLPFHFTGGLGLPPSSVGLAMALIGTIGISMQLFLYPWLSSRFGTVRSWRMSMFLFPITYMAMPYLAIVPSTTPPPEHKTGAAIWVALTGVLLIQVTARTFALPAQTILVNNCTPHPSVLGTVHGLGQSFSSLARTIGPMLAGWLYGVGLDNGVVGAVFWSLAGMAICGLVVSLFVREGTGHDIWLEGDEEG